jgi:hypothetical protein
MRIYLGRKLQQKNSTDKSFSSHLTLISENIQVIYFETKSL